MKASRPRSRGWLRTLAGPLAFTLILAAGSAAAQEGLVDPATLPRDFSALGMTRNADWLVQSVMFGLAFASVLTWAIFLVKSLEITTAKRSLAAIGAGLAKARSVGEAARHIGNGSTGGMLIAAASAEMALSKDLPATGAKERIAARLARLETASARRIGRGLGLVATIGATAPFVGLFGTVWGIMNSFIAISRAATTNLAIVAPGIAEALLATAIGLGAAIPAVVIYNFLSRRLAGYRAALGDLGADILILAGRDLDGPTAVPAPKAA